MEEIKGSTMAAKSPREATYAIRLLSLAEGYAVETKRGCSGKTTGREIYWRPTEGEAKTLYESILRRKMASHRKRAYREFPEEQQMDLL